MRSCRAVIPSQSNTLCKALMLALAIATVLPVQTAVAVPAAVREAVVQFDIPSGELSVALERFSTQSGMQAMFREDLVAGKKIRGIKGVLTPSAALVKLLDGTSLSSTRVNDTTFVIKSKLPSKQPKASISSKQETSNSIADGSGASVKEVEKVSVVGSRLGTTPSESALPVKVITRDEIERSGAGSISQMLSYLSEVSVNGNTDGSIGTVGNLDLTGRDTNSSSVQLRGLPVGTTLILINGRRSGETAALMHSGQFDLSTIPLALVERIEVLPAGASAVYGGDGLAGIVNIVLRNDASGMAIRVRQSHADGSDELQTSLMLGKAWSRGSMTAAVTLRKSDGLDNSKRKLTADADFRRFGGRDLRTIGYPGSVYSLDGCPENEFCFLPIEERGNLPGLNSPFASIPAGQDGKALTTKNFLATAGVSNSSAPQIRFSSPETNHGLNVTGYFDASKELQLFGELSYSKRNVPATEVPFYVSNGLYGIDTGIVPASNAFNPFGVPVAVDYYLQSTGVFRDYNQTYWRALVGARGKAHSWAWEVSGWRSRDTSTTGNVLQFYSEYTLSALAESDPSKALNLFGGNGGLPISSELMRNFLIPLNTNFGSDVFGMNAYAHGPLIQVPSGNVDGLIGIEYQRQALISKISILNPEEDTTGTSISKALFAEMRVPILSGLGAGKAGKITATGAFRIESTDRINERARTETLGIEYRPNPFVLFRGTYSTAFKPLPIYRSILSSGNGYGATVQDPDFGGATFRVATIYGGGLPPNLRPETSRSQTIGLVITPSNSSRLSLTLWKSELIDLLYTGYVPLQFFMDHEDELPGRVVRDPSTGVVKAIDLRPFNISAVNLAGADIAAEKRWTTGIGEFTAVISATYMERYEQVLTDVSPAQNNLGVLRYGGWAPRWKIVPRIEWFYRDTSISLLGRYVSSYDDTLPLFTGPDAGKVPQLGNFWMADLNVELPIGKLIGWKQLQLADARISLGARNLFNRLPDFCNSCELGYDASQYDIVGRSIYLQARLGF